MADLTNDQRRTRLSTYHTDELGALGDHGESTTGRAGAVKRDQWLSVNEIGEAGTGKSGNDFIDSADQLTEKPKFNNDQKAIIAAAKGFAASPKALSAAQEKLAVIPWSTAALTLPGVSFNLDLKARLVAYARFLAWANLVTGPHTLAEVVRSPSEAHLLSVAWMFNLGQNKLGGGNTLHSAENRNKLVASVNTYGGRDQDGNQWLSATTVDALKSKQYGAVKQDGKAMPIGEATPVGEVTKDSATTQGAEAKQIAEPKAVAEAKQDEKATQDDDAALFAYIKSTVAPEANKVKTHGNKAAEGYKDAARRHPNVLKGDFVSNHVYGEAVDLHLSLVFNNMYDPMIDAIAMHFGLWRPVKDDESSPEHWHYERIDAPPGKEMPFQR